MRIVRPRDKNYARFLRTLDRRAVPAPAVEKTVRSIIEAVDPVSVARWRSGDFDATMPGGESRRSLMARTRAVLDEIISGPHAHVALFSHGGTLNALHTHMVEHGQPTPREYIPRAFRFHNAAVSMAAYAEDQWRFLVVNSTFHLDREPRQFPY